MKDQHGGKKLSDGKSIGRIGRLVIGWSSKSSQKKKICGDLEMPSRNTEELGVPKVTSHDPQQEQKILWFPLTFVWGALINQLFSKPPISANPQRPTCVQKRYP